MILIKGENLQKLIAAKGLKQLDLEQAGVMTRFHVSRLCQDNTENKVRAGTVKKLADYFEMPIEQFIIYCKSENPGQYLNKKEKSPLTKAEEEFLHIYQSLSPLNQAKARIALEQLKNPE